MQDIFYFAVLWALMAMHGYSASKMTYHEKSFENGAQSFMGALILYGLSNVWRGY